MAHSRILIFFICNFGLAAGQIPKYALRGQEIIMVPTISGQPDELLWKHNGNKVVDFNGREEEVYGSFENRVTLHWTSAELKIVDLRYEDRGEYELEAFMNKRLHRSSHHLEVIDKVPQPSIACEMNNNGRGNTSGVQATLVCSAESKHPQFLKFMWRSGGVEQPGPNLTISLGGQHEEEEYSCEVSNPLSRGDATFNAKDCYPGFSSGTVALPVVVVIISAMCFLLAVLAYVFRTRLKACHKAKKGDLEGASPTPSGGSSDQEMRLLHSAATLASKQQLQPLIQRDSEVESRDPDSKRTAKEMDLGDIRQKGIVNKHRQNFEIHTKQTSSKTFSLNKRATGDDELPSSPNSPEQKEPQKTQPLESRERDDNQQERSSAVSADEEVADGEGDQQVTEEEDVQSPAATQDSQTSTLRKADNGNTRTSQGSPDAAHGGPDPEGEGEDDSGVSDEQPGNSAEEEEDEVTVRRQTVSRVTSQSR